MWFTASFTYNPFNEHFDAHQIVDMCNLPLSINLTNQQRHTTFTSFTSNTNCKSVILYRRQLLVMDSHWQANTIAWCDSESFYGSSSYRSHVYERMAQHWHHQHQYHAPSSGPSAPSRHIPRRFRKAEPHNSKKYHVSHELSGKIQ